MIIKSSTKSLLRSDHCPYLATPLTRAPVTHRWPMSSEWFFLSPGFSPKLLTSNLSILKLALYFTEKINEMCFTNNQDL